MRLFSFARNSKVENTNKIQKEEKTTMQKKIASKISAGVLSAVLVLQGMFPTVAVMADELSETEPSGTVIDVSARQL